MRAAFFVLLFILTNSTLLLLYHFTWERFFVGAVLYTIGTLLMLFLLFNPRNQFLVANRSRVESNGKRRIALTFDDGPNPEHTKLLLNILREKSVKATFFVVGKNVLEYPDLARLLIAEGHQIASHTYSHPLNFCFLLPRRLQEELQKGMDAIVRICDIRPSHFRSPAGLRHPLLRRYLHTTGMEYISWSVRGFDSRVQDPMALARRITNNVIPGSIILLHDQSGRATDSMLQALPRILDDLKSRGFEFVFL